MIIRNCLIGLTILVSAGECRDSADFDDVIKCGFGKEYVSGYTRSNGTKVSGYCRDSNSRGSISKWVGGLFSGGDSSSDDDQDAWKREKHAPGSVGEEDQIRRWHREY